MRRSAPGGGRRVGSLVAADTIALCATLVACDNSGNEIPGVPPAAPQTHSNAGGNEIPGVSEAGTPLLGYTSQDYLLRSAGVAFRPAAVATLLVLAAVAAFKVLTWIAAAGRPYRIGCALFCLVAAVVCLAGGLGLLFGVTAVLGPTAAAIATIVGALGIEAAALLSPVDVGVGAGHTRRLVVVGLVAVGCFWGCAVYAQQSGTALARSWEDAPAGRPGAVVYARSDLDLHGPGLRTESLPAGHEFRYRYSGLRVLIFSDGRWFLIPDGWRRDNGAPAIVLAEGDGIRVETTAP